MEIALQSTSGLVALFPCLIWARVHHFHHTHFPGLKLHAQFHASFYYSSPYTFPLVSFYTTNLNHHQFVPSSHLRTRSSEGKIQFRSRHYADIRIIQVVFLPPSFETSLLYFLREGTGLTLHGLAPSVLGSSTQPDASQVPPLFNHHHSCLIPLPIFLFPPS